MYCSVPTRVCMKYLRFDGLVKDGRGGRLWSTAGDGRLCACVVCSGCNGVIDSFSSRPSESSVSFDSPTPNPLPDSNDVNSSVVTSDSECARAELCSFERKES